MLPARDCAEIHPLVLPVSPPSTMHKIFHPSVATAKKPKNSINPALSLYSLLRKKYLGSDLFLKFPSESTSNFNHISRTKMIELIESEELQADIKVWLQQLSASFVFHTHMFCYRVFKFSNVHDNVFLANY